MFSQAIRGSSAHEDDVAAKTLSCIAAADTQENAPALELYHEGLECCSVEKLHSGTNDVLMSGPGGFKREGNAARAWLWRQHGGYADQPERIIIGGGVSKCGGRYCAEVRAVARSNTLPQMRVDIVLAALGDDALLWGAIALGEGLIRSTAS